ncbi:MAG: GNAT family N-acetyltransferase [Kiritimatiellaeota bacterium]|nr:GNAT family N-acetyltransferase [Kiritimatiellota bacterium]
MGLTSGRISGNFRGVNPQIQEALSRAQLERLAATAREIWLEYYPAMLPVAQIRHMLDTFQSADALERSRREELYRYFLLVDADTGETLGYLAFKAETHRLFFNKAYLKKAARGRGHFNRMLAFVEAQARAHGLATLYLNVNKDNAPAIAVYGKKGFVVDPQQRVDTAKGYHPDDLVMEKRLA